MGFDFNILIDPVREILSAPGTDLTTISAKRVRRQLQEQNSELTSEFMKENKEAVDDVIALVFERVSAEQARDDHAESSRHSSPVHSDAPPNDDDDEEAAKPASTSRDAEIARQLSSELNGRSSTRRATSSRSPKKGSRTKRSAATIENSDEEASRTPGGKKTKSKSKARSSADPTKGGARGGFAKEYALSPALSALLNVDKLSRPQVVKHLWVYIKGNSLQNPENKREIMCDDRLRAVFNADKIDMFRMNKDLGQHLYDAAS
ncbi:SWIB-domain-containing protein [Fistulina hepatica ATCC 64428]|uniref:SWIB-domain-containing protein n=1 Tax=Fistulina hepatica ATCC 64428 TaxID=1128425 RepID=A0A0D7AG70_9AGAR|nr:SWIB-domain-containing protein [Fistulina hepatica ATCC 64428]